MAKMNPEVKAKWVAALRSGEYQQTTKVLKDAGGSHCCLGVLCALYAKERTTAVNWIALIDGDGEVPAQQVCEWAGFTRDDYCEKLVNDPEVWINDKKRGLSAHNDQGRTFTEIADAIEAQL